MTPQPREALAREVLMREIEAEGIAESHALRREAKWQGRESHTKRLENAAIRAMLAFTDIAHPHADREAAIEIVLRQIGAVFRGDTGKEVATEIVDAILSLLSPKSAGEA